jgi:hypothetical protein
MNVLLSTRECLDTLGRPEDHLAQEAVLELRCILDELNQKVMGDAVQLSAEDEYQLAERLFSVYLNLIDGVLMW